MQSIFSSCASCRLQSSRPARDPIQSDQHVTEPRTSPCFHRWGTRRVAVLVHCLHLLLHMNPTIVKSGQSKSSFWFPHIDSTHAAQRGNLKLTVSHASVDDPLPKQSTKYRKPPSNQYAKRRQSSSSIRVARDPLCLHVSPLKSGGEVRWINKFRCLSPRAEQENNTANMWFCLPDMSQQ